MYYVYILEYAVPDKEGRTYYVGQTHNSWRRIQEHILGIGAKRTQEFGVKSILYLEIADTRDEALDLERILTNYMEQEWTPKPMCSFVELHTLGLSKIYPIHWDRQFNFHAIDLCGEHDAIMAYGAY